MMFSGCGSNPTQSKNNVQSGQDSVNKQTDVKNNVKKDITYKSDNGNDLKLDVYYPSDKKNISKTPTVVLIHGKAPDKSLKDSFVYRSWGKTISESGFTTVIFNWRPSSSSTDVSDLIKYIRENSKKLNINGDNICIFAQSAGVRDGINQAMQVNTGFIKNVIVYYGQIDESILKTKANVKLPSFFIAMGAFDEYFPPDTNDNFINMAKASGSNVIKMVHSKGGHAFDLSYDDDETKNIIDETLKFIKNGSSD